MSDYCHLCDFDPCTCGRHGQVEYINHVHTERTHSNVTDDAIRAFVLTAYEAGDLGNWGYWRARIIERYGEGVDHEVLHGAWNRVNNELHRDWLLISDPNGDGPMQSPDHFPGVRRLALHEAIAEIEKLIDSGAWTVGEKGLRLWRVWRRVGNCVYTDIYDALHDMNKRGHRVTTTAPSGKPSQFWYVKP